MAKKKKKDKELDYFERLEAEGKVLAPKVGKEKEFWQAMAEAHKIGTGALGWDGQAEIMSEILSHKDAEQQFGMKLPKDKNRRKAKLRGLIIQSFVGKIFELSDWVTKEEADTRMQYNEILYIDDEVEEDAEPIKK